MVDQVQKMLEDVGQMQVKELPALVSSIESEIGVNESQTYNDQVSSQLDTLSASLKEASTALKNALNGLTGQAVDAAFDAGADMGAEAGVDAGMAAGEEEADMGVMENISLQKVAPAKMGDNGANTKSPTTFNSGAAGMQGKPVRNVASEANPDGTSAYKAPNSYADKGRGDLPGAGSFKNVPAKGGANAKLAAAPKPHLAQAAGVNTKTPFPKG
jgi:hypothetical protein